MQEKYDDNYENKIVLLAENKIKSGRYKVFDHLARVISRECFPELVNQGKTDDESCLIITNKEGETLVITQEFEHILFNALKHRV
jgi:hypothetical protein